MDPERQPEAPPEQRFGFSAKHFLVSSNGPARRLAFSPGALSLSVQVILSSLFEVFSPLGEIKNWSLKALIGWKKQGDVRPRLIKAATPPPVFTLAAVFGQVSTAPDGEPPRSEEKPPL